MLRTLSLCVVVLAAAALPAPARATTVVPLDEAQLAKAADLVVQGRVVRQQARIVGRRIVTFAVLRPEGAALTQPDVVVAIPGGVVGSLAQRVPGAPILVVGRRYRLYLAHDDGPAFEGARSRGVLGFWQGAYALEDDGAVVPFAPDGLAGARP